MDKQVWYAIIAVIMVLMIPIVPKMVQLRVAILRRLHLRTLADWHERNIEQISRGVRVFLGALAVFLLVLALWGSG